MSVNQPGDVAYGFSQALLGVPSKPIIAQRSPTTNDKAQIGTSWIDQVDNTVFIITSIVDNIATWVQTDSSGSIMEIQTDAGANVFPAAGVIRVMGGSNINTFGAGNTVTVNLNNDVNLPATNAGGTQGVYQIGGANFLFGYGPTNTFVGGNAGNTSLTVGSALHNVGVGNLALSILTTGFNNVAVGYLSLTALTTGDTNIAIGNESLGSLVTGSENIAIGFGAGSALNGSQSNNIYVGSAGNVADSNVIRIGTQGGGAGQQNSCFVAGIGGVTPGGTPQFVTIDPATGQMGSALHTGAIETLDADIASASGSTVTLAGGNNITTVGDNVSTILFDVAGTTNHSILLGNISGSINSLGVATDGQIPIGSTGADPVLASLTAGTNISIVPGAGSITINSTASSGVVTIDGNTGSATGSTITFTGAPSGQSVKFTASGSTVSLNLTDSSLRNTFLGLNAGNGAIAGNLNTSLGYGTLPSIDNGTLNTAIGYESMTTIADGSNNVALGAGSLGAADANKNTAIGTGSLGALSGGDSNIALGYAAGSSYNASEGSNIVIGNTGTPGDTTTIRLGDPAIQTGCFIAGIGGVTPGGTPQTVIIDPVTGQMGSTASGGSGITTINGDTGSATGATVTFNANSNAGASVKFVASGAAVDLKVSDTSGNTFIGSLSGNGALSGNENTGVGRSTLLGLTSGADNTAFGFGVLQTCSAGNGNVGVGQSALTTVSLGSLNTAVGVGCLNLLDTGANNIGIGDTAGGNYTSSESSNIVIGNAGTVSESNVIRIGTQGSGAGQQDTCFIAGITGVTVGSSAPVLINTGTGELGTVISSRRYKENIEDMENASSAILELRPVKFNYKNDSSRELHYGLIAEEVDDHMPNLVVYTRDGEPETVRYHELPALLLNELQKQHAIIVELSRRLERLETRGKYESTT